jgi:formate hydrogenlyase subunit 6/NADH:ubiquinone oxidoreductase subunit I
MSRCTLCSFCVEICPTAALLNSDIYELSSTTREEMVFNLDQLHKLGGFFPEEPEKEEESEPEAEQTPEEEA